MSKRKRPLEQKASAPIGGLDIFVLNSVLATNKKFFYIVVPITNPKMKRRRFLSSMAVMLPMAVVSTEMFLSSCNTTDTKEEGFTEANIQLLDEIGETIIPATATSPGAKAARIGQFMKVYVTDCYDTDQQKTFWAGINNIKNKSIEKYNRPFPKLTISQKKEILNSLLKEPAKAIAKVKKGTGDAIQTGKEAQNKEEKPREFFSMIQNLTVFGYFTSQPGATKAVRYIQTPGSYKGEVSYKKGDKAWAT
ncbi:MAG TPA: gluconate 2-dehydrogenase subunit 3 family protein [Hanamia sp.]|nr:gluconate 2-dehydrogenase subunit 3 family protein [Hanamia sp.]